MFSDFVAKREVKATERQKGGAGEARSTLTSSWWLRLSLVMV